MTRIQANMLLLLTAMLWGSTFVVQQVATGGLGAIMYTSARFFMGGLVVLPLAFIEFKRKQLTPHRISSRDWLGMVTTGIALCSAAVLQQVGIFHTTVSNAGFLTALYVPLVPLIAFLFLRASIHWSVWPASIACLLGTYTMTGAQSLSLSTGDIWVMASALFWALHVLLVGAMATRTQAPLVVAAAQFFTCSAAGLITAVIIEQPTLADFDGALFGIFYGGILSVGTAFTLQVVAQRYSPAPDAAILLSSETVFAAVAGFIFLGERLSPLQLAGAGLIFTGILAVQLLPLYRMGSRRADSAI